MGYVGPRFVDAVGQAFIFSLAFTPASIWGFFPMMRPADRVYSLLGMLILAQTASERDNGLLWGCIGLHGGLVSWLVSTGEAAYA